jgi:hypothetical protein
MNRPTLGCAAATTACLVLNAHADTIDVSIERQLTPNETTNVVFNADSQPHTPANPTTSTLIVPVAVGPGAHDAIGESSQISSNVLRNNTPIEPPTPPVGDVSEVVLTAVALGVIPQPQQSGPSVPVSSNPLPPASLLFGTALMALFLLGRRRFVTGLKSPKVRP